MKKNFEMIRGDSLIFTFEVEDLNESLASCYFSCKKDIDDAEYTFQKTLGDGIENIEENKYKVRVAPTDTKELDIGKYIYDLQIGVGEDIFTVMTGQLVIDREITEE